MPISNMKNDLFICDCGDIEHQLVVSDDTEDNQKELNISIHLYQYRNFFQRLLVGIKYIFGKNSIYGNWDVIILNEENIIKLKNILENKLKKD